MTDGPDYNNYSHAELLEAYESIDRSSFPERFKALSDIMEDRGLLEHTNGGLQLTKHAYASVYKPQSEEEKTPTYTCIPPEPQYDKEGNYIPNEIPLKNRVTNALLSLSIILYGSYGLYIDELWVPVAKRTSIVLSGVSALLMFIAILCAAVMFIAEVVDHYDKRDNEHTYYKVALYFKNIAYVVFGIAVIVGLSMGARLE